MLMKSVSVEITRRIEALKSAKELERKPVITGLINPLTLMNMKLKGYEDLFGENDEFRAEVDGDD